MRSENLSVGATLTFRGWVEGKDPAKETEKEWPVKWQDKDMVWHPGCPGRKWFQKKAGSVVLSAAEEAGKPRQRKN